VLRAVGAKAADRLLALRLGNFVGPEFFSDTPDLMRSSKHLHAGCGGVPSTRFCYFIRDQVGHCHRYHLREDPPDSISLTCGSSLDDF
jgi:hypothetical protein